MPFDRWREVNADGVVIGTVQKTPTGVRVEMKLYSVRGRQASYSREYTGAITSKRLFAHQMADEIHQQQRALRGVARTKLTFNSDRDGDKMPSTIEKTATRLKTGYRTNCRRACFVCCSSRPARGEVMGTSPRKTTA